MQYYHFLSYFCQDWKPCKLLGINVKFCKISLNMRKNENRKKHQYKISLVQLSFELKD